MNKTKKLIEEAILLSIGILKQDLEYSSDIDTEKQRAEAIKILAEAYDIVHRGKKG